MKKTIFLDIDGCLIKHNGNLSQQILTKPVLLPGTIEKINEWEAEGHKIILTTGRKESMRKITEEMLTSLGIFYEQLVMGCNRGERIIINDDKPNNPEIQTAKAIQLKRNNGIGDVNLNISEKVNLSIPKQPFLTTFENNGNYGSFYTDIVNKFDNAIFVELGVYLGQSSIYLASKIKELNKSIKVYAIDKFIYSDTNGTHGTGNNSGKAFFLKYIENIEKYQVRDYITPITSDTHFAHQYFEDVSIDFLFIDANHSYESVKKDLELWYPKVKYGGVISGHDYNSKDVKRAVDEYFKYFNQQVGESSDEYVWFIKKEK
jgi:hypothetical protein